MQISKLILLLSVFLLFLGSASANPILCQRIMLGGTPIGLPALEALHKAVEKKDYNIEILNKEIDGKNRVIVLAGETHVKNSRAAERGKALVANFRYRGLEGVDLSKNWAGVIFNPILKVIDFVSKKFLRKKGSTLTYASVEQTMQQAMHKYAKNIADQLKEAGQRELSAEQEQALAEAEDVLFTVRAEDTVVEVKMKDIASLVKEYLANESVKADLPVIIHLEAGHKPGLRENLEMLEIPVTVALLGASQALAYAAPDTGPVHTVSVVVMGLSLFKAGYDWSRMLLKKKFEHKNWFNVVFPLHGGLLDGRNATMVANIEKGFNENPDADHMLVIVGRGHVPGMKKILRTQLGYSSSPLPVIPPEPLGEPKYLK